MTYLLLISFFLPQYFEHARPPAAPMHNPHDTLHTRASHNRTGSSRPLSRSSIPARKSWLQAPPTSCLIHIDDVAHFSIHCQLSLAILRQNSVIITSSRTPAGVPALDPEIVSSETREIVVMLVVVASSCRCSPARELWDVQQHQ